MVRARFHGPHPNDGTGPGVLLPVEVKLVLDSLDGTTELVRYAIDSIKDALENSGVDGEVFFNQDYISIRTFPSGRNSYPQHNWRAIWCDVIPAEADHAQVD